MGKNQGNSKKFGEYIDSDDNMKRIEKLQETLSSINEENFDHSLEVINGLEFSVEFHINTLLLHLFMYSAFRCRKRELYFKLFQELVKNPDYFGVFKENIIQYLYYGGFNLLKMIVDNKLVDYDIIEEARILSHKKAPLYDTQEIVGIIERDDIDEFKKKVLEPNFNFNQRLGRIVQKFNRLNKPSLIQYAALCASLNIFKYLFINDTDKSDLIHYAIAGGNVQIIQILDQAGIRPTIKDISYAAMFHQTDIFDWVCDQFPNQLPKGFTFDCVFVYYVHGIRHIPVDETEVCLPTAAYAGFTEFAQVIFKQECVSVLKFVQALPTGYSGYPIRFYIKRDKAHAFKTLNATEALMTACRCRRYATIHELLKYDQIDVNRAFSKTFPLLFVVQAKWPRLVELLLTRKDINVNKVADDDEKSFPLLVACHNGDLETVKLLCQHPKIDINKSTKAFPLIKASRLGFKEIVEYLFSLPGININQCYERANSFSIAVLFKQNVIVELFLENKDFRPSQQDFIVACSVASLSVIKRLSKFPGISLDAPVLSSKPIATAFDQSNLEVFEYLLYETNVDVNVDGNADHDTFMEVAAGLNLIENAKILLKHPKINKTTINNALVCACNKNSVEIIKMILEHPLADINYRSKKNNLTPILSACSQGRVEAARVLMQYPELDVNSGIDPGKSLPIQINSLLFALTTGKLEIIKMLLSHPRISEQIVNQALETSKMADNDEIYKLFIQCPKSDIKVLISTLDQKLNEEMVEMILSRPGLDINENVISEEYCPNSMFEYLIGKKFSKYAKKYLEEGKISDVNINKSFFVACQVGDVEMAKLLISQPGFDANGGGWFPPLLAAFEFDMIDIMKILLQNPDIDVNITCKHGDGSEEDEEDNGDNKDEGNEEEEEEDATMTLFEESVRLDDLEVSQMIIFHPSMSEKLLNMALIASCRGVPIKYTLLLLTHPKIDVNFVHKGTSPLFEAIQCQNENVVAILLKNPATNVNLVIEREKKKITPIQLAEEVGNQNIMEILSHHNMNKTF